MVKRQYWFYVREERVSEERGLLMNVSFLMKPSEFFTDVNQHWATVENVSALKWGACTPCKTNSPGLPGRGRRPFHLGLGCAQVRDLQER